MSNTRKGGASLRLVAGLTSAALIMTGVIAANLKPSHLTPGCTLTGRNGSSLIAGDVAKLVCSNLNDQHPYRISLAGSTSWSTVGRGNLDGTTPSDAYKASSLPVTIGGNVGFTTYILVAPGATSNPSNVLVDDVDSSPVNIFTGSVTVIAQSAVSFGTPTAFTNDQSDGASTWTPAHLTFSTALPQSEQYQFKASSTAMSPDLAGWLAGTASSTNIGSSSGGGGAVFDSSTKKVSYTIPSMGSTTDLYFASDANGGTSHVNATATIAILDQDGNEIMAKPAGTDHVTITTQP